MKYLIFTMALLVTCQVFAQDGSKQAERLKKELQLTEQQFASVKLTNEKFAREFMTLKNDASLSKESKREKARALKARRVNEISSVLTAEQNSKWEKIRAERDEEKKKHKKERKENIESLNLTEAQKAKMKEEHRTFKAEARELKNDKRASKEELKTKKMALKADYKQSVKKILSEDQFAKWQGMKGKHPHKKKHH